MALLVNDCRGLTFSTKALQFEPKEILVSVSQTNVFRGFHQSPYRKAVYVVTGKIVDFWYDPVMKETFQNVVSSGGCIQVPAGALHGFFALEPCTLLYALEQPYRAEVDNCIHWSSPDLPFDYAQLPVPLTMAIISSKDQGAPFLKQSDYLLIGYTGFLGSYTDRVLRECGLSVYSTNLRLDDTEGIGALIKRTRCRYVICAAGISGRPTVAWCESNEKETFRVNLLQVLNLVELTERAGVHLTVFGSALVYEPPADGYELDEAAPPTLTRLVYTRLRIALESHLRHYSHVLYLRMIYPVLGDGHAKCFLTKMRGRVAAVDNVQVALTVMPSLFPLLPELIERRVVGSLNFVNSGTVGLPEFLHRFGVECEPAGRAQPATPLSTKKLASILGRPVPAVTEALAELASSGAQ